MSQIWMKRLSHVWMSYVTHMNEEVYHTYASVMSHVRMKKCVTHMQESCSETSSNDHMNEEVYQVMSHIWMKRYITHMQESYSESSSSGAYFWNQWHKTYAYTHINESFHAYSWVVWRIRMSHAASSLSVAPILEVYSMGHITHTSASYHACEWVMSHINETCHTYESVGSHMRIKSCQELSLHLNWFDQQFDTNPLFSLSFLV